MRACCAPARALAGYLFPGLLRALLLYPGQLREQGGLLILRGAWGRGVACAWGPPSLQHGARGRRGGALWRAEACGQPRPLCTSSSSSSELLLLASPSSSSASAPLGISGFGAALPPPSGPASSSARSRCRSSASREGTAWQVGNAGGLQGVVERRAWPLFTFKVHAPRFGKVHALLLRHEGTQVALLELGGRGLALLPAGTRARRGGLRGRMHARTQAHACARAGAWARMCACAPHAGARCSACSRVHGPRSAGRAWPRARPAAAHAGGVRCMLRVGCASVCVGAWAPCARTPTARAAWRAHTRARHPSIQPT